jgi:hypothetical protein
MMVHTYLGINVYGRASRQLLVSREVNDHDCREGSRLIDRGPLRQTRYA